MAAFKQYSYINMSLWNTHYNSNNIESYSLYWVRGSLVISFFCGSLATLLNRLSPSLSLHINTISALTLSFLGPLLSPNIADFKRR